MRDTQRCATLAICGKHHMMTYLCTKHLKHYMHQACTEQQQPSDVETNPTLQSMAFMGESGGGNKSALAEQIRFKAKQHMNSCCKHMCNCGSNVVACNQSHSTYEPIALLALTQSTSSQHTVVAAQLQNFA
eukprot:TRINITY_DN7838_c0_g1_i11.p4 TRINITY_DN7838_c0_g1~~TRINITY_DN7838_c0_g1_i11.p4  ORF type:complete len:131 (+),score=3.20 TRINITY_DN7838_c0_g1_i11:901-1293(+)